MLKSLRDHYLRIDARSLGLFRIGFALVLIADLYRRWRHLPAFYSNEGVLPNHNHLFNLRGKQEVWSVYHAFSGVGETRFAFVVTFLCLLAFLIGWRTRLFHALALAFLVSLGSRNIMLENAGNFVAVALCALTLLLPLGSRFSLDALRASLHARDERTTDDLNDRSPPRADGIVRRAPGWSPLSIAALGTLLQIAIVFLVTALEQNGPLWRDGSALHYALHVERWVTGLGASMRSAPPGLLKALTHLLRVIGFAVPLLIFLPVWRRAARSSAAALMVVQALMLGLFFDFGLYAWTLAAAAALVISGESWEARRLQAAHDPSRARTVIYDVDCGLCLWICRLLKRLDTAEHLTFQGNSVTDELLRRAPGGEVRRAEMPSVVAPDILEATVVVVDWEGRVFTRGRAVAEVARALPLGKLTAPVLRAPGISHLLDVLYDFVATRRQRISALLGFDACGIPIAEAEQPAPAPATDVPPANRLARLGTGALREGLGTLLLVAALVQTARANPALHAQNVPQGKVLAAVVSWPRMLARWNVLASPPTTDGWMVIDGQTRGGRSVDPLTGVEPVFDLGAMRGTGLGQLWADYLERLHDSEWKDFEKAFKDYLVKNGPRWEGGGENQITGLDAYWVSDESPPPGSREPPVQIARDKLFTHSRGGRSIGERMPLLRPDVRRPPQ